MNSRLGHDMESPKAYTLTKAFSIGLPGEPIE